MFDGDIFGAAIVEVVKGYVARSNAPLLARIEALEKQLAEMPVARDAEALFRRCLASGMTPEQAREFCESHAADAAVETESGRLVAGLNVQLSGDINRAVTAAFDLLAKEHDPNIIADAFVGKATEFWVNEHGHKGLQTKLRTLNKLFARPIDALIERISSKDIAIGE